jgi:hypothetical protein
MYPRDTPSESIEGLLKRVLPTDCTELRCGFDYQFINSTAAGGADTWALETTVDAAGKTRVSLFGNNGVAVASALNHYLFKFAHRSISWDGDNLADLPAKLPPIPGGRLTKERTSRWSYYENTCTVSYSMAWWDWARWERELDWMALSGVNLPLAFMGQEWIYRCGCASAPGCVLLRAAACCRVLPRAAACCRVLLCPRTTTAAALHCPPPPPPSTAPLHRPPPPPPWYTPPCSSVCLGILDRYP